MLEFLTQEVTYTEPMYMWICIGIVWVVGFVESIAGTVRLFTGRRKP